MATRVTDWIGLALAGGRYQVTAKLGEGGMGCVYRALDRNLDADVVIKVPRPSMLDDPEFAHRFAREVRSLVKLTHPGIVKVTDVGEHDGAPFAVMQYLPGGSLEDRRSVGPDGRYLPAEPASVPGWLGGVAAALDYVHSQGYVHRDIKPGNILFDAQGHVFLSDFGVAKALISGPEVQPGRTAMTGTGLVLGTPEYMAPELIMGEAFDGRADQYALAVTVYEMLSGRRPFEGNSPTAILVLQSTKDPTPLCDLVPGLSRAVSDCVLKGLSKDPRARFADCAQFAAAVSSVIAKGAAAVPAGGEANAGPKPVRLQCPSCHKVLVLSPRAVAELKAGRTLPCPSCQAPLVASGTGTKTSMAASTSASTPTPRTEPATPSGTRKLSASSTPAPTPAAPAPPKTWVEPAPAPTSIPQAKAASVPWPWIIGGASAAAVLVLSLSAALVFKALSPTTGTVRIQLPATAAGASVVLDERRYDRKDFESPLALPPGEHRLTVRKPGFTPYEVKFVVNRGVEVDLPVQLVPGRVPGPAPSKPAPPARVVADARPAPAPPRPAPTEVASRTPAAEPPPPPAPAPAEDSEPSPAENLIVSTPVPAGSATEINLPLEAILDDPEKFANQLVIPDGLYCVNTALSELPDGTAVLPVVGSRLVVPNAGGVAVQHRSKSVTLSVDRALADKMVARGSMRRLHRGVPALEGWGNNVAILTVRVARVGPPGTSAWDLRLVRAEFLLDMDFNRIGKGLYARAFKTIALAGDEDRVGLGQGEEWSRRVGLHFTNSIKNVFKRIKNAQSQAKWAAFNATMGRMFAQGLQQSIRSNAQFDAAVTRQMTGGR